MSIFKQVLLQIQTTGYLECCDLLNQTLFFFFAIYVYLFLPQPPGEGDVVVIVGFE